MSRCLPDGDLDTGAFQVEGGSVLKLGVVERPDINVRLNGQIRYFGVGSIN